MKKSEINVRDGKTVHGEKLSIPKCTAFWQTAAAVQCTEDVQLKVAH